MTFDETMTAAFQAGAEHWNKFRQENEEAVKRQLTKGDFFKVMDSVILRKGTLANYCLADANLAFADLAGANLAGAILTRANLEGAILTRANLEGAILEGAILRVAILRGADLRAANLEGADLRAADLWGANLEGANLSAADLSGAILDGAIGLPAAGGGQVSKAEKARRIAEANTQVFTRQVRAATQSLEGHLSGKGRGEWVDATATLAKLVGRRHD
jgi:uncharacterized protein YjbI with pentapeptide repeats